MLKRIWSAVVAILLVSASTAPARACTRPRGPLECVASVALTVTVDGASVFPGESARAAPLERRLLAVASRALAEAGVASDPSGRDLHLDVFREGDDLIVVASPRGEEATGSRAEADWQVQKTVEPADGEEAATLAEIENSFLRALSGTIGSKESCLPDRYSSAHGRFVFEIPSENPLARARYLRALLWKEGEAGLDLEPRGSLFERSASGREELRSTFRLPREALPGSFLVADDGRFVVEAWRWASVGDSEDALILFWSDGTEIRRLSLEDLLTPGDLQQVRNQYATLTATALDDENDRLVIAISRGDVTGTIEIDLETGELTEPKHDHLTQSRVESGVYVQPVERLESGVYVRLGSRHRSETWREPVCTGERVDFTAADLAREAPARFYGHALPGPLPEYPELAKRARLEGTVDVEAVVAASGEVSCARVTELPMGLSKAVEAVVLHWRFRPFLIDGQPARSIGRFSFHFGLFGSVVVETVRVSTY